jgi:hypothetical protein
MNRKNDVRRPSGKRVYRAPELKVHGDLRKLTQTKGGDNGDGGSKPATKTTGAGA